MVSVPWHAGGTVALMFVLMVANLLIVVSSQDPLKHFRSVFFYQGMVLVLVIWLFSIALATVGAMINEEISWHW